MSQWGNTLQKAWNEDALLTIIEQEHLFFPWAVKPFVQIAMADVIQILNENFLYEYVSGYDIEQHTESGWKLTNKIEDKFTNSLSLNLQNYTKNQAFRIRTYYKDESVMLYGEYKESVWK